MKNQWPRLVGRKLRIVRMALPSRMVATQTFPLLKTNQELTYPSSHEMDRTIMEKGARSVLMPPPAAASHQTTSRSHNSLYSADPAWLSISEAVKKTTAAAPASSPTGCRNTACSRTLASSSPQRVDRKSRGKRPGISTHRKQEASEPRRVSTQLGHATDCPTTSRVARTRAKVAHSLLGASRHSGPADGLRRLWACAPAWGAKAADAPSVLMR